MPDTFQSVWRRARLYCGHVPATLAREWTRDRYRQILNERLWGFQVGFGVWGTTAPIQGVAQITQGSPIITFTTPVLPGDNTSIVGMQVKINSKYPYYSVVSNPSTTQLVMDAACVEPSSANANVQVVSVYFTPERSDFESLIAMVDRVNNYQLRKNVPIEEIENGDPMRSVTGPPMWLVPLGFNDEYLRQLPDGVTDRYGQTNKSNPIPYCESWPQSTTTQPYPYAYERTMPDLLADTDTLPGFLQGQVLVEGLLSDLCSWPGTEAVPNPARNPVEGNRHERRFDDLLFDMKCRDQKNWQRTLKTVASYNGFPLPLVYSARYWQQHVPTGLVTGGYGYGIGGLR